ncbi:MAG: 5'-nucleotidase [Nonlabens sp.]
MLKQTAQLQIIFDKSTILANQIEFMKFIENAALKNYAFAKAISLSLLIALLTGSCKSSPAYLEEVAASQIAIDSTQNGIQEIEHYIAPFKEKLDATMDEPLSYNPVAMHKNDYRFNTPIGNMMAAIIRIQGSPIIKSRTGEDIDAVLLNHGGIRAPMPAGPVTMRTAYEVMPFENEIVVARLTGDQINQMINYLVEGQKAHPFDGLELHLKADGSLKQALINGKGVDKEKIYRVATNDYLYNGGDNMSFFEGSKLTRLDYKIRNAMIDFFKKTDTLKFKQDTRFTIDQ